MAAKARSEGGCWVLIPAFNEAETIRTVVEGALAHVDRVLVISDGSTDGTVERLRGLPVEVVQHETNRGKGRRLPEGLDRAFDRGADAVLTMDADGQHDADDIPDFLAAARAAPDALVIGERWRDRAAMPPRRALSIGIGDFFIGWATEQRLHDAQCGMRIYPRSLWRGISLPVAERQHFVFETAVLLRAAEAGFRFVRVPVKARYAGYLRRRSHYRPALDTLRIVRAVTKFLVLRGLKPRGLLIAARLVR